MEAYEVLVGARADAARSRQSQMPESILETFSEPDHTASSSKWRIVKGPHMFMWSGIATSRSSGSRRVRFTDEAMTVTRLGSSDS